MNRRACWLIVTFATAQLSTSCHSAPATGRRQVGTEYDSRTGKLVLIKYDSNANGRVDMWSHMDGVRIVRIDIDKDEDGRIDRWEYYGPSTVLTKVGFSRRDDGIEDAWTYARTDGSIDRIEISTTRNRVVDRIEHYSNSVIVSAEEDSDRDGRMDKWETYAGGRLVTTAFDTKHQGRADRRVQYRTDGRADVEIDEKGDGHFVKAAIP